MRGKLLLLLFVLLGGGLLLACVGAKNISNARKLAAAGQSATATVLDRTFQTVYKDQKSYHLLVAFRTGNEQSVTNSVMVTKPVFDRVARNGSVNVFYLPADPSICIVANHVEVKYEQFVLGCVFFGLGVLLAVWLVKSPSSREMDPLSEEEILEKVRPAAREGVQKIVSRMELLTAEKYEYKTVDARQFPHLDLQFYDLQQRFLESRGFVFLEDCENVTMRKSVSNPNVFIRVLLGGNGTIMAGLYHFKPALSLRAAGAKQARVLDLETWFSNGSFVCTSNAENTGKLSQPAEVDNLVLPGATPFDKLLETHKQRINQIATRTGAQPVLLNGIADVRKAGDELHRLKAEHRRRTGLSPDELAGIAGVGKGDKAAALLSAEIKKELNHGRTAGK
jgi:hypothetical protein